MSEITITRNADASVTVHYQHPRTLAQRTRTFVAADGTVGIVYERVGDGTFPVGRKLRRTTTPIVAHQNGLLETIAREARALLGHRRDA